jgi:hypothetical protein
MNVNEAIFAAEKLESLARRIVIFNKSREDIIEEIEYIAKNYRATADRIDEQMYAEYVNELALEQEKYEDRMIVAGA